MTPPEPTHPAAPQVWSFDADQLLMTVGAGRFVGGDPISIAPPPVASVMVGAPRVRTSGCLLPEGEAFVAGRPTPELPARQSRDASLEKPRRSSKGSSKHTRIRPPRDIVKLSDRLQYLLQPPLESLLAAKSLRFPFHPFPYQLDGVAFLYPRQSAVLADEMGLGKTMQTITTIRLLAHSGQVRRVLLICPKPLITNWRREFALWAPELSVVTIEGATEKRRWAWDNSSAVVTMTNYETAVRDAQQIHESEAYDLVVTDEAQRIKNRSGATAGAVRGVPRKRSWALTGTPIENSLDDLVGIFEFVSPGKLRLGQSARQIGSAVGDSVLRRTKDQVMTDMPPKIVRDEYIDLTPEQWDAYQNAEQNGVLELEGMGQSITLRHVFELVLRLKQICNFDPATKSSSKLERLEAELEEVAASGRKAIVFSQWVETIDKIAERLERFSPAQYHGRVPHAKRDGVIDRFKNDPKCSVILMSYGAGSVGLNLQFSEYVFLFDRWWNPAVEDQAINRAHRIGAKGAVTVTRYIAMGTIEQRIDEILAQKRELFDSVFNDTSAPRSYGLSRDELLSLFHLQSPDGRIGKAA
ncbi:ATP-dependent helicase HepA [Posidoniimonas polymericola]|uniref:ATP-dependent helicase HepA n=1 Tax=Posidoniimonas polymericola TaxID=2528002 RepID=A0A5C5YT48_9BACT|nr:DEAD/DEAH box helicase [Posidoniimonas polymericola]TWT77913.1 ATP-dependent helicase HepA [Posidoniimonas polymericola]